MSRCNYPECGGRCLECQTPAQINAAVFRAATQWCGEKERETFQGDIDYFVHNWRYLPGLKDRVLDQL